MKSWFQSKTIWGAGLFMLAGFIQSIGVTIDPMTGDFSGNIYDIGAKVWPHLIEIGGGALVWYGRLKATVPIKPIRARKAKV
jgi:hypothetical protein